MLKQKISLSCERRNFTNCAHCVLNLLRLHLIHAEEYLLLLEEREPQSFSIHTLELIGLTKREAEVLFWIAKDKGNAEIAKLLGCSQGTVRKHLEHLYRKLGVQTRTAAVIVALEKLGVLQGDFVSISS